MRGRHHTPEARSKIRAANLGRKMSPEAIEKFKKFRATQVIPVIDTKPEMAVKSALVVLGVSFESHRHITGLNHQWDIVIQERMLLIEVDGCYWHNCEACGFANAHPGRSQRDAAIDVHARQTGWRVSRIWEHAATSGNLLNLLQDILSG